MLLKKEFLTRNETMKVLGISNFAIYHLQQKKELPFEKREGRVFFKSSDIKKRIGLENAQEDEKILTSKEVAKILRISIPCVTMWRKSGVLPSKKLGGKVFFKSSDIKKLIGFDFDKENEQLFTSKEVAEMLNINLKTLLHWRRTGRIKETLIQGKVFFKKSEVDKIIKTK